ncbi:cold shock and DUF1294 domain-containing protein [Rhodoferax sp.]|uniref:cold shock and DUF1294 domain-containing protein n=1 Tax=Rhodoferax sp. TaxID=50421 RepID=UPI0025D732C7|nr:cold shock and DUF1294 domain-containing protein [Rhodoferax sp.]
MQKQGQVVRFDAQRGFGFIRCNATSQDIFFHIRDCHGGAQPPLGATVDFEEIHVGGKGPRAMAVRQRNLSATPFSARDAHRPTNNHRSAPRTAAPAARPRQAARPPEESTPFMGIGSLTLIWIALLVWGIWQHKLPLLAGLGALGINLATFFAYWVDKYAAQKGQWRTKEDTLHLLALAGGWPAARAAQQVLRHKTVKASFQTTYWVTVWLHLALLAGYLFWERIQPLLK